MKKTFISCMALLASLSLSAQYSHTVQAEKLDRGVVAVKTDGGVFVSWRSLISDDKSTAFDVYRDGVKITASPITTKTNMTDAEGSVSSKYTVKALVNDQVTETSAETSVWETPYLRIHLNRPEGGTAPAGGSKEQREYTYTPDDISVADVDGDGEWELIVKWFPTNQADNGDQFRYTGNTILDCYKLDGTQLWRIDLGQNIRSGNHYTQFMVYDFDGDGKAELICKTAPGTIDGKGNPVLMGEDKVTDDYRTSSGNLAGVVIAGPEYLTVFNGQTGAEINTIPYNPPRDIKAHSKSGWGDANGNRCERYLAGVAYLDGKKPSAVFVRGYYTHSYVWAVDFDGQKLTEKWLHVSDKAGQGIYGEGSHSLTVGDVDGDGFDEIIIGAGAVDHDGQLLHRTGAGHGDALHLGQFLPDREGLQIFMPHEEKSSSYKWDTTLRDARTGEILFGKAQSGNDIGRGLIANITSKHSGYEYWAASDNNVYNNGVVVGSKRPSINFRVYWDGDLLDELLDGTSITKPNEALSSIATLVNFSKYSNAASCNSTKATPNLQADLFGDWREEVILHDGSTESDLMIFTTTIPTDYKVTSLMQDRQYRVAVAWQNVAYNQPPHLSYNLEERFNTHGAVSVVSGALSQVIYAGDPIQPISFKVLRATGAVVENLPEGLNFEFDAATLTGTISGTPKAIGEYNFTLSTTGAADDANGSVQISINVRQNTSIELVGYFPFENVGETTPNLIGGEATAHNGKIGEAVGGKVGNALSLDGTSRYVQNDYELIDFGDKSFTIELWMNSTTTSNCYLLNKGVISPSNGSGNWYGIEYKDNKGVKELRFAVDDNINKKQIEVTGAEKYFDGEWHHVVAARDAVAKRLFLYVDGELVAEDDDPTVSISSPGEPLVIGDVTAFDNPYNGLIDELSIYRGVMSASKVKEHFEASGAEYVAYFPMDEIGETTPNLAFGEATAQKGGAMSVDGLKAGAIEFDNSYYLTQPIYDAINMGEKDFTIELWARSTDDDGYLLCLGTHNKTNVEGGTGNWIGLERKNGYLGFSIDDDVKKEDCQLGDASAVFDGEWHHIACVRSFDDKTLKLYVDGKESASKNNVATGAINFSDSELMFIGGDDESGNRTFAGAIDELLIYPKALTPEQIEEHYNLLRLSEIPDIIAESANARYTVVDAFSGRIIRTAVGVDRTDIVDSLQQGVYILVVEDGKDVRTFKFVKR
ncbi:MAG: T9SS type A sorting domain-containing protein [Bacteroides sp.]|nr:T9SS type A sorting domain-containing protein [Bacteroides sp.]